ncbi:MAG: hypothetical protein ACR2LJ_12535 [Acidimicrobiales bacterium]
MDATHATASALAWYAIALSVESRDDVPNGTVEVACESAQKTVRVPTRDLMLVTADDQHYSITETVRRFGPVPALWQLAVVVTGGAILALRPQPAWHESA